MKKWCSHGRVGGINTSIRSDLKLVFAYNRVVRPTKLFGLETVVLTKRQEEELEVAGNGERAH